MVTQNLLILFLLALVLFMCYFMAAFFTGAPFVPTPMKVIKEMIAMAKINKKDIVYDLGSGDGRMLIEAAKVGAHAHGWEINPFLASWTRLVASRYGIGKRVKVHYKSYHNADLKKATVVFLYNLPAFLPALEKKFHSELKPGTKIFSYKFPLTTITPNKETESGIYYYIKS